MPTARAEIGKSVTVAVKALLDDGSIALQVDTDNPLNFVLDANQHNIITGLAEAVIGMVPNEHKKVTLPPQLAYGSYDPENTQSVKTRDLGRKADYKIGDRVILQQKDAKKTPIF